MPSNAPFGFRPYRHLSGGDPNRVNEYPIATGYSTTIGTGDPVKLLSDGTIAQAAAGERILGIFLGCSYVNAAGEQIFARSWPASTTATDIKASVCDDRGVVFQVQSGGTPTLTNSGNLADHVVGTVSTVTGISGATLDSSMSTGAAGFRVLRLTKEPGNSGANALLEVTVYEHEFSIDEPATPGV